MGPALVSDTGQVKIKEFYGNKKYGDNIFIHNPDERGYGNAPVKQEGYSFVAIIPHGFGDGLGVPKGEGLGGAFVGLVSATASKRNKDKTIFVEFANGNRVEVDLTLLGKYSTGEMLNIKCVRLKEGVTSPMSPPKEEPVPQPRAGPKIGLGNFTDFSKAQAIGYNLGKTINRDGKEVYEIVWWEPYYHSSMGWIGKKAQKELVEFCEKYKTADRIWDRGNYHSNGEARIQPQVKIETILEADIDEKWKEL